MLFYGKRIAGELYNSVSVSYTISDRLVSRIAARNSPLIGLLQEVRRGAYDLLNSRR